MKIQSAKDLLAAELRDIYSAEKQASRALPKLAKAASSDQLRQMIERRKEEGAKVLELLDQIFQESDIRPGRNKCEAMEGLIEEANEHVEEIDDDAVLDAAILGSLQRIEHYCIASWGTAAGIAKACGLDDAAKRLSETIDVGRKFDEDMTQLAESEINPAMLADDAEDDEDESGDDEAEEEEATQTKSRGKSGAQNGARKSTGRSSGNRRGEAQA